MKEILYYRIVDYHEALVGHDVSLNIFQLLGLLKSEPRDLDPMPTIDNKYFTYIKMGSLARMKDGPTSPIDELVKQSYPWLDLIDSVRRLGIVIPILVTKIVIDKRDYYVTLEGRHRLLACAHVVKFDQEHSVPSLVVDKDEAYTEIMHGKEHPRNL